MTTIKSARRVMEIFEVFAEVQSSLTLKEIMARLGYPASSASGLLKCLVSLGYLDYDRVTHRYMPTMRLPDMVQWVEPTRFAGTNILPIMNRLHVATGETICLGTQSDLYAQYIHVIHSTLPAPYRDPPKTVRSLARCGLGWLLLSVYPDDEIEYIVRRINVQATNREDRANLAALMVEVERVRTDGYVFSRHTVVRDGGMIGMLIPRTPSRRRLAIGVHGPVDRLEQKKELILDELRASLTDELAAKPECATASGASQTTLALAAH